MKNKPVKLRITAIFEYDAYPKHYLTDNIEEMIAIDSDADPLELMEVMIDNLKSFKIEKVE